MLITSSVPGGATLRIQLKSKPLNLVQRILLGLHTNIHTHNHNTIGQLLQQKRTSSCSAPAITIESCKGHQPSKQHILGEGTWWTEHRVRGGMRISCLPTFSGVDWHSHSILVRISASRAIWPLLGEVGHVRHGSVAQLPDLIRLTPQLKIPAAASNGSPRHISIAMQVHACSQIAARVRQRYLIIVVARRQWRANGDEAPSENFWV